MLILLLMCLLVLLQTWLFIKKYKKITYYPTLYPIEQTSGHCPKDSIESLSLFHVHTFNDILFSMQPVNYSDIQIFTISFFLLSMIPQTNPIAQGKCALAPRNV